jgi:hypothetical protein
MQTATDEKALWDQACAGPHPFALALLGDMYEEAGDQDAADCLHWCACALLCVFPYRDVAYVTLMGHHAYCYDWHDHDIVGLMVDDYQHRLPGGLYQHLPFPRGKKNCFQENASVRDAYDALIGAWRLARAAGWSPDQKG